MWFDRVLSVGMFDGMILVEGRHVLTLAVVTFYQNDISESDSRYDGSYQHDNWTTNCQKKKRKNPVQNTDQGFIPEIVIVNIKLPGNPLRAHLVETRDPVHGSDGESCKQKNRHADNNYDGKNFCWNTCLSSHWKQDIDTSFI